MDSATLTERHNRVLFPCVHHYYKEPIAFARGQGATLVSVEGREYLDLFGGILTVSLGHCYKPVAERIAEQVHTLQHTSTLYPTEGIVALAEKMAALTPGDLNRSFFSNSGTEADETALLLARMHAGGAGDIVALRYCYSGRSQLAMNVCAQGNWRLLPTQVPGIKHAHAPYCYRCALGLTYPSCELRCAHDLEELILTETCGRIAGFIAEPILGVGGFIVPPPEYFKVAVDIVRRHGGLFIADEVQTGWGRTGGYLNGIEHWGVVPDIMTYAKGMANGFPIGATVTTDAIAASLSGLSISTFGGNPVAAAAALATIEAVEREGVVARAAVLGARIRTRLEELQARYPWIGDVRGMGLMLALELVEDRRTKQPAPGKTAALMEESKREGLLLGKGGLYGNVIRVAPPMLIGDAEVDDALERLARAMARVQ